MWVRKMVEMAISGPAGQGLFMLSVSDAREIRGGYSTNLERALCLAYLPTSQGNICSASSLLPQSSPFYGQISSVLAGNMLYDPNPLIEVIKRSQIMDENEIKLHPILGHMGLLMDNCFQQSNTPLIVPNPYVSNTHISVPGTAPGTPWELSTYLNDHWKHLTETAIDLKIFFKENLTDIKRVTGIKYIALVLGGYFQIRLLIDDVINQCRDDKRAELESFKTPQETPDDSDEMPDDSDEMPDDSDEMPDLSKKITDCRRGLLPLLIQPPLLVLIQHIIQLDRQTGTNYDDDPIPRILKILGFLFSIKVKSSSPHSPYQLLRLEDSILHYPKHRGLSTEILRPSGGMFIEFLRTLGLALGVDLTNRAIMKCICRSKGEVAGIDMEIFQVASSNPLLEQLYTAVGGRNNSESNSGRKSVSSLNKHNHKHKHNKLARNNRTHRNKNKRKKNSKSKSHKPKSKSKSKSKSGKSKRKNVTFKRRKRSNRH
jgi:hypothetical protein